MNNKTETAVECGHPVSTFDFMASCGDGVIRTMILAPLVCEECRILRQANNQKASQGSRIVGYRAESYSGQTEEWRDELKRRHIEHCRLAALGEQRAWPSSRKEIDETYVWMESTDPAKAYKYQLSLKSNQ